MSEFIILSATNTLYPSNMWDSTPLTRQSSRPNNRPFTPVIPGHVVAYQTSLPPNMAAFNQSRSYTTRPGQTVQIHSPVSTPARSQQNSQQHSQHSKRTYDEMNASPEGHGEMQFAPSRTSPSHSGMRVDEDPDEDVSYSPPKKLANPRVLSGSFDLDTIGRVWDLMRPMQHRSLAAAAMAVCVQHAFQSSDTARVIDFQGHALHVILTHAWSTSCMLNFMHAQQIVMFLFFTFMTDVLQPKATCAPHARRLCHGHWTQLPTASMRGCTHEPWQPAHGPPVNGCAVSRNSACYYISAGSDIWGCRYAKLFY